MNLGVLSMVWYLQPWDRVKSLRGEDAGGVHGEAKSTPAFTSAVGEEGQPLEETGSELPGR